MRTLLFILIIQTTTLNLGAQNDREMITEACYNYIDGFYQGDTNKLIACLQPSLYKFGYWKDKNTGRYAPDGNMTYRQALDYATRVSEKKNFAKPGSPRDVMVLDVLNSIAAARVKAWWGYDYILLARQNDQWMIAQVLWEGPLEK